MKDLIYDGDEQTVSVINNNGRVERYSAVKQIYIIQGSLVLIFTKGIPVILANGSWKEVY